VAIALSIAHLLYTLSHPAISELGRVADSHDYVDTAYHPEAHAVPGLAIYRVNAPLIFANAETSLRAIAARVGAAAQVIVSLEESDDLDATAVEALGEFAQSLGAQGKKVLFARVHDRARDVLARAGLGTLAASATFSVADAVAAATTVSTKEN